MGFITIFITYTYIYMIVIAGQTDRPNRLAVFEGTLQYPGYHRLKIQIFF